MTMLKVMIDVDVNYSNGDEDIIPWFDNGNGAEGEKYDKDNDVDHDGIVGDEMEKMMI